MGNSDSVMADERPPGPVPMTAMRSCGEMAEGIFGGFEFRVCLQLDANVGDAGRQTEKGRKRG